MLLLNVKAVLDRDADVKGPRTFQHRVLEECDDAKTPYAILSHRWQDKHEVDYIDMIGLMEMQEDKREEVMRRSGYQKILACCERALSDSFEWLWVDTCCIDKRSSSELSEAINSMYRWYENSTRCYAYLHDVDSLAFPTEQSSERFGKFRGWPEWFSRGWTLQELIAPRDVQFFNKEWVPIGNKRDLADTLEKITRISKNILISGLDSGVRSAAQVMSWAADRKTSRVEDRAYSLLGLFRVHMPMLYGEGKSAFQRLQLEIIRSSNDHSIFAWDPEGISRRSGSILADDPRYFRNCNEIWSMEPEWFVQRLKSHMQHRGVTGHIAPANLIKSAILVVRKGALVKELSTCSITSGGLQISLPIAPHPGSPSLFRATLGCVTSLAGPLMTIDLVSDSTRYYRFFGATGQPTTFPRVKQLFLSYYQDDSRRNLRLDDRAVSFYGFQRCGTFPRDIVGNSVKLSITNDMIVVIYANDKAKVRFTVGFGYYFGSPWTHIICDESHSQATMPSGGDDYVQKAYDRMWNWQAHLASNDMSDDGFTTSASSDTSSFIKHAHLPRSIWAVRFMWGVWYRGNCNVTVDIVCCTGCCRGPLAWKTSTSDWNGLETPGPMEKASLSSREYALYMDGIKVQLLRFPGIGAVQLGDYGHFDANFKLRRDGNIFQNCAADPAYDPIEHKVSTGNATVMAEDVMDMWASHNSSPRLMLRQPIGLSLPNNRQLVILLKELSCRLTDKCLVTSVVRCRTRRSDTRTELCYLSTPQVWRRDGIDQERRAQFREIREQFYALLNWSRPATSAGDSRSSNSKKTTKEAIQYFSTMFGIEYLETYVGKIMFFKKLSAGSELSPDSETPEAVQDPSINMLVKTLHRRMDKVHEIPGQQMQGVKHDVGAISKTLGIKLLAEIAAVYSQAYHDLSALKGKLDRGCVEYDMSKRIIEFISSLSPQTSMLGHTGIHDMVEEIKKLQEGLDTTKNNYEQCALEEDVTGRILWACYSGLYSVVGHIPAKVLHSALANDSLYTLMDRLKFLEEISRIFNDALAELPTDDQAHLQRIMADADTGTSKYKLLLAERAREKEHLELHIRGKPQPNIMGGIFNN